MIKLVTTLFITLNFLATVNAECPNACSSHGRCGAFDMCFCYRNWMSNDCSERICQFGLAHVDSPKGDLDSSSGALSSPDETVILNSEMYPYGTQEQFPNMVDSDNVVLDNTAHYYMECSNKGICDREQGVCECFPGYEGSACQRASCPSSENGVCSGHGTCQSIREIAGMDHDNMYQLWDADASMGCVCDAGYYGADCSLRHCKYGVDPLYVDDNVATKRVPTWTYTFYYDDPDTYTLSGNYSIIFYDVFGEDWETDPIQHDDDCTAIVSALESIPNKVIHSGTVTCTDSGTDHLVANQSDIGAFKTVTLEFNGNPGKLKEIKINKYLDGPRPTLFTDETTSTLGIHIYADGFSGEFVDYVPDHCEDVLATLSVSNGNTVLSGLTSDEIAKLKRCLGDANGDTSESGSAAEVYNWDYGDINNPHLVKLIDSSTSDAPGFFAPLIFDGSEFVLYSQAYLDFDSSTEFHIFTTTGRLNRVSTSTYVYRDAISPDNGPAQLHWDYSTPADTIDCETSSTSRDCLDKNHLVMFIDMNDGTNNPKYHNLYTVEKIYIGRDSSYNLEPQLVLDMNTNLPILSSSSDYANVFAYRFYPPAGVEYVSECSGRGLCDSDAGICDCFTGYTGDDCSSQNILAQ